jgi:hypothetical protein
MLGASAAAAVAGETNFPVCLYARCALSRGRAGLFKGGHTTDSNHCIQNLRPKQPPSSQTQPAKAHPRSDHREERTMTWMYVAIIVGWLIMMLGEAD